MAEKTVSQGNIPALFKVLPESNPVNIALMLR
jgi:hypothetical protein